MPLSFADLLQTTGLTAQSLVIAGIGLGALLAVFGLSASLSGKDPVLKRIEEQGRRPGKAADQGILRQHADAPKGMMKTLIPADEKARSAVRRQLVQAGFAGPHSLRNFYLLRLFLGFGLPLFLLGTIWASRSGLITLPAQLDVHIAALGSLRLFQILSACVVLGFFLPAIWMRSRAEARRRAIEDSFPNALDLVQISVEAGLGFDAAMIRVGNELAQTAPEIATEFLTAQREIQAGRTRDRALLDMAVRTGVNEVAAFSNVVLQSIQFGTSISDTLTSYAREMRLSRELRAQEKANKLPVQMSAVMAMLMLPSLLLLALGPILIRYMRFFAG